MTTPEIPVPKGEKQPERPEILQIRGGEGSAEPAVAGPPPDSSYPPPVVPVAPSPPPQIVLPLTREEFPLFLRRRVGDASRWLAEWVKRMIKLRLVQQKPVKIAFES